MKNGLLTILLMLTMSMPAIAAPFNASGPWGIDASGFRNLSSALMSPATAGKTVIVSKPMAINNKTLPSDRQIKITKGGRIEPASGKIFDFNGQSPECGNYTVFAGAGTITGLSTATPEHFGAVAGDNIDDGDKIQKAIRSLISGGICKFTGGTYLLNTGRTIAVDINGKNNITLRGSTGTKIQIPLGATETRSFVIRNSTGLLVDGIYFENLVAAPQSIDGLMLQNVSSVIVQNCTFKGHTFYGVGITQDTVDTGTADAACNDILIINNKFDTIGTIGLEAFPKVLSNSITVRDNQFISCGGNPLGGNNGAGAKAGQAYTLAIIENNTFDSCGAGALSYDLAVVSWDQCTVRNNTFLNSYKTSIAITVGPNATYAFADSVGPLQIFGNRFADAQAANTSYAIAITSTAAITEYNNQLGSIGIFNNSFKSMYGGISLRPTAALARVTIQDNTFLSTTISCIYSDTGGLVGPVVSKNTFISNSTSRSSTDIVLDSADAFVVADNTFIGSGIYALQFQSGTTGATIAGNSFVRGNVTGVASRAPIQSGNTIAIPVTITNNHIVGAGHATPWAYLYSGSNATPTVTFARNTASVLANATPTKVVFDNIGLWTSNADAAVNGYISVTGSDGAVRKLATIP